MNLLRSRILHIALLVAFLYWAFALPFYSPQFGAFINWVRLAIAVTVLFVYSGLVVEALTTKNFQRSDQLILGIFVNWLALAGLGIWSAASAAFGWPNTAQSSSIMGFLFFGTILGGVLHITAPGIADPKLKVRNWWLVFAAVAAGGLITGAMLATAWWRGLAPG